MGRIVTCRRRQQVCWLRRKAKWPPLQGKLVAAALRLLSYRAEWLRMVIVGWTVVFDTHNGDNLYWQSTKSREFIHQLWTRKRVILSRRARGISVRYLGQSAAEA